MCTMCCIDCLTTQGTQHSLSLSLQYLSHMFVAAASAILVGKSNVWSLPLSWDQLLLTPHLNCSLELIKYKSSLFEKDTNS